MTELGQGGNSVKVLRRAILTSDSPDFYKYLELFTNIFLNTKQIPIDEVCQFLVIIHQDLSADLYVNDFGVLYEVRPRRDLTAGEVVMQDDIVNIGKVKFSDIEIRETNKVIYCFKVGWRFGLFFDLTFRSRPVSAPQMTSAENLDIERMQISIGELRRYLMFYHVYKVLESDTQFEEMMKDGWFPFNEILSGEYKILSEAYQSRFDFDNKIKSIVDSFTFERVKKITNKWWGKQIFLDKKSLIEAGVNAYLQNSPDGFVNCIKNLWTEIEGVLRKYYYFETGVGDGIKSSDLMNRIIDNAKNKSGSEFSLLLETPFLKYLDDVVFARFNVEAGSINMSRNASSHGVAEAQQYTKDRALQLILILDQIYIYI